MSTVISTAVGAAAYFAFQQSGVNAKPVAEVASLHETITLAKHQRVSNLNASMNMLAKHGKMYSVLFIMLTLHVECRILLLRSFRKSCTQQKSPSLSSIGCRVYIRQNMCIVHLEQNSKAAQILISS